MCLENRILKMSLQDLDGEDWGEPPYPSHLVTEYHRLRRVRLEEMNVEDLRLLVGQELSLPNLEYLLPLAFEHLLKEPWVSGNYYEGDLLGAVLSVSESFWHAQPQLKRTCDQVVQSAINQVAAADPEDAEFYETSTLQKLRKWPGTL